MLFRIFVFCFLSFAVANCEDYWESQEAQVLKIAKKENLPIIAVFYGAQNCPWSQKLQAEVLEHPGFRKSIKSAAVFWQSALVGKDEDKPLRDKYRIHVSPLILLLDPKGREFARMEYAPWDMKGYASEISARVEDFQELCLFLNADHSGYDEEKWIELYQKAKKLSAPCYKQVILEKGLQTEKGTFFHIEKLASLLEKYKLKHPQVIKFKKQLLERDASNQYGTHFKVAVLEFNKILAKMKRKDRVEKPLVPLLQYVYQIGKKDQENFWKAELMIAEYLSSKNFIRQAVEHVTISYQAAPESAKAQILETISHLQRKVDGAEAL